MTVIMLVLGGAAYVAASLAISIATDRRRLEDEEAYQEDLWFLYFLCFMLIPFVLPLAVLAIPLVGLSRVWQLAVGTTSRRPASRLGGRWKTPAREAPPPNPTSSRLLDEVGRVASARIADEEVGDALEVLADMRTRGESGWACCRYALRSALLVLWHSMLYRLQALLRGERAGGGG